MTTTLPLIEAGILQPIVTWLDGNGANAERHLDANHIPGELVEAGGWISKRQVYGFLTEVVQRERCEHVGFASYAGFQLDDLGSMADAIRTAETVNDALVTFSRLAARAFEGNQFWLEEDGDDVWLCNRILDDVAVEGRAIAQHASVMILTGLLRSLAGAEFQPRRIRLQVGHTNSLASVPGLEECEATFDYGENAIAFPARFLSHTTIGSWQSDSQPVSADGIDEPVSFVRSLHRLVESRIGHARLPTLQMTAEMAGVSVRTVKRRLFDSGITYRDLLDRVRYDRAREMLLQSQMSVKAISHELGYANPSNFIRAFQRIAGVTPTAYRRQENLD